MTEICKDVKDYEGYYQVSNKGRVKRLVSKGCLKERILKPAVSRGYLRAWLSINGEYKRIMVHRLVAIHFIPNPDNLPQVNHIDNNKQNNYTNNLEWCTASYNALHATYTGNMKRMLGETNPNAKLKNVDRLKILNLRRRGKTYREIALIFNCSLANIGYIVREESRNTKKQEEMKKAFKSKYR